MIYSSDFLQNLRSRDLAEKWLKGNLIVKTEHTAFLEQHPTPYQNHSLIYRVGLFLLTLFTLSSAIGFFTLITLFSLGKVALIVQAFIWALVYYFVLRFFVRVQNQYKSGVVEALSYSFIAALLTALYLILDLAGSKEVLVFYLLAFPILVVAAIYLVDNLIFTAAFFNLIAIVFLAVMKIEIWGKLLMPFILMLFAIAAYTTLKRYADEKKWWMYSDAINLLKTLCLLLFYLAGNYFVVRELSNALSPNESASSIEISFSWFFKFFTILVPLFYIYHGLKTKQKIFLQLGALLLIAGILSLKYYFSILAPEYSLSIAGAICIALCLWLSRFLKTPKNGISLEPSASIHNTAWQQVGSLVLSQQLNTQHNAPKAQPMEFKGGEFGGGGAGSDY
jgi:hypothetical protein